MTLLLLTTGFKRHESLKCLNGRRDTCSSTGSSKSVECAANCTPVMARKKGKALQEPSDSHGMLICLSSFCVLPSTVLTAACHSLLHSMKIAKLWAKGLLVGHPPTEAMGTSCVPVDACACMEGGSATPYSCCRRPASPIAIAIAHLTNASSSSSSSSS